MTGRPVYIGPYVEQIVDAIPGAYADDPRSHIFVGSLVASLLLFDDRFSSKWTLALFRYAHARGPLELETRLINDTTERRRANPVIVKRPVYPGQMSAEIAASLPIAIGRDFARGVPALSVACRRFAEVFRVHWNEPQDEGSLSERGHSIIFHIINAINADQSMTQSRG